MLIVQLHSHLKKIQFGYIFFVLLLVGLCAHFVAFFILFKCELQGDEIYFNNSMTLLVS